jgi:hypothetical protein
MNSLGNRRTILAICKPVNHIGAMATRAPESVSKKSVKHGGQVLGRSAATGRFILMPASKTGSITIRDANTAVKLVLSKKK